MSSGRGRAVLKRQWLLIELLANRKRGLSVRHLIEHCGTTKSTLYRDIAVLREIGIPIESDHHNGEARYTLWGHSLPPLGPSALQIASLRLARRAMVGLEGTSAAAELDKLLEGYARAGSSPDVISFAKQRVLAPDLVKKLDRAIHTQRRTRIRYRSANARTPEWRTVDPLCVRCARGHLYFVAYDDKRRNYIPFKLDRLTAVDLLPAKAASHPDFDADSLFARSAKIWTGPEVHVRVRLTPQVARFANEYPLVPDQVIEDEPDGSRIIHARVAGVTEAMRWVLSWGKEAEALEPAELRAAVAAEVTGAAERYRPRAESTSRRSGRLTRSGTGLEQSRLRAMERGDEG